ncbi:NeuD/PglB/VioB family sugar acetyltransferase [Candidatus Berkiella aquae]|uniref:Acetyltransferase n=1 Tax=Candidatus Berkiella aquae TaxID=295108 RepID=A0AAE3HXM4_9GAMM|nr:acetyltransferase [Candidatus Berkiella aquae]MCS5712334.1 acetyltransferase [Candidatus Berkiella aquae]
MSKDRPLIIIGAGGHAAVLAEIIKLRNLPVVGVVALNEQEIKGYPEYPYLGKDEEIDEYDPATIQLVNAVGAVSVEKNAIREQLFHQFTQKGYHFATLIHPSAVVASTATFKEGAQIMAGAIIQPNVVIGHNTIINTGASIDHDCEIGDNVHIAPRATLSGNIKVGNKTHIGVGATLIQGITVGDEAMICAGAIVIRPIASQRKVLGSYKRLAQGNDKNEEI